MDGDSLNCLGDGGHCIELINNPSCLDALRCKLYRFRESGWGTSDSTYVEVREEVCTVEVGVPTEVDSFFGGVHGNKVVLIRVTGRTCPHRDLKAS